MYIAVVIVAVNKLCEYVCEYVCVCVCDSVLNICTTVVFYVT